MPESESKRSPDIATLIAAGVGVVALVVWIGTWWVPLPQDEVVEVASEGDTPKPAAAVADARSAAPVPDSPVTVATRGSGAERPVPATPEQKPQAAAPPVAAPAKPAAVQAPESSAAQSAAAPAPRREALKSATSAASLGGRYDGNYFGSGGEMTGLRLVISGVENGVVTGTATLGGTGCNGVYPMRGTYQGGKLNLRATRNGGPAGDCPLNLALAVQADLLVGATDTGDKIQLRK